MVYSSGLVDVGALLGIVGSILGSFALFGILGYVVVHVLVPGAGGERAWLAGVEPCLWVRGFV
jgi:hypothetical protein